MKDGVEHYQKVYLAEKHNAWLLGVQYAKPCLNSINKSVRIPIVEFQERGEAQEQIGQRR